MGLIVRLRDTVVVISRCFVVCEFSVVTAKTFQATSSGEFLVLNFSRIFSWTKENVSIYNFSKIPIFFPVLVSFDV